MYYFCNSAFSIIWLYNSQQGHDQRNEGHGPLWPSSSPPPPPPHHWPLKYTRSTRSTFIKDSNTQNIHRVSLLVFVGPSDHPFQRLLKYAKHMLSSPPCFRWPLKIKYTRSTRSPFSDTPQIHKSYIEFPSLLSLAPQVTLFKDSSNTQNICWVPLLVFVGP